MNEIECESCIKRKTIYCPSSSECYDTVDKPYYQNRIMLLKENQQLKEQLNKKYENVGTLTSEILYEENTKLVQENQQLKEQLERSKKARIAAIELINKVINMRKNGYSYEQYKKYLDETLDVLDIDKGE